jgi:hypothetical protein
MLNLRIMLRKAKKRASPTIAGTHETQRNRAPER